MSSTGEPSEGTKTLLSDQRGCLRRSPSTLDPLAERVVTGSQGHDTFASGRGRVARLAPRALLLPRDSDPFSPAPRSDRNNVVTVSSESLRLSARPRAPPVGVSLRWAAVRDGPQSSPDDPRRPQTRRRQGLRLVPLDWAKARALPRPRAPTVTGLSLWSQPNGCPVGNVIGSSPRVRP